MVTTTDAPRADEPDDAPDRTAPRPPRTARTAAIIVGVVLVVFIALLATRKPNEQRFGPNPQVDKPAPAVVGTSLTGEHVDIDRLKGKWVVVNFFATWCVGCREEHPELVKFAAEHDKLGDAQVVSVAFQDQSAALKDFFAQQGGSWPVVVGDTGQIAIDFGVTGIPESFVVAPSGLVVAHFEGVDAATLDSVIAAFPDSSPGSTTVTRP